MGLTAEDVICPYGHQGKVVPLHPPTHPSLKLLKRVTTVLVDDLQFETGLSLLETPLKGRLVCVEMQNGECPSASVKGTVFWQLFETPYGSVILLHHFCKTSDPAQITMGLLTLRGDLISAIDGGLDNPQGLKEHSNAGPILKGKFYGQVIVLWSEGAVLDVILCCSLNPCAMLRPFQM